MTSAPAARARRRRRGPLAARDRGRARPLRGRARPRAKRAVAIALRNRMRRRRLPPEVAAEITPKNILMIGPTGVGKTEIARRLAQLAGSPFIKVEASKFTEVGYVGRDVDSIVRDLVAAAIDMVRREKQAEVQEKARGARRGAAARPAAAAAAPGCRRRRARAARRAARAARARRARSCARSCAAGAARRAHGRGRRARAHDAGASRSSAARAARRWTSRSRDMLPGLFGSRTQAAHADACPRRARSCARRRRRSSSTRTRSRARRSSAPSRRASCSSTRSTRSRAARAVHGPDVSREGVQRDLLPIVEGTTVSTKYGPVRTDHVLFIAAGAFHVQQADRPDPRAAGPLPDPGRARSRSARRTCVRILTEPRRARSSQQYRALLATEGVELRFTDDAVAEMARFAAHVNDTTENIGARRLATILETVLDEVSFEAGGDVAVRGDRRRRLRAAPARAARQAARTCPGSSSEETERDDEAPTPAARRRPAAAARLRPQGRSAAARGAGRRRRPPSFRLAQRGDALELPATRARGLGRRRRLRHRGRRVPVRRPAQVDIEKAGTPPAGPRRAGRSGDTTLPLPAPGTLLRAAARGLERGEQGPRRRSPWRSSRSRRSRRRAS